MHRLLRLAAFAVIAGPLAAQSSAPVRQAAETITKEDVARHINVIAADSMMGRNTPSPGLEMTAQYVADQFKKFGLKPGGDKGTWFQRYPTTHRLGELSLVFAAGGKEVATAFSTNARVVGGLPPTLPARLASTGAVLIAGRHTAASLQQANLRDKIAIYVAPAGADQDAKQQALRSLLHTSKGLIIVYDGDSASFTEFVHNQPAEVDIASTWGAYVWPGAVRAVFAAGGLDWAQARADTAPVVRALPRLTVRMAIKGQEVTAPNTVGILAGSDPKLKSEYIVFSAHMDHVGISAGQADSINNGADDDGSGTTGIIELAEAFSRPGARPKRSLIFLTVSGEEKGLWGSDYFSSYPPVPLKQIVADLNVDMIGRNWKDTVVAIGKEHSDLGATLNRVTAAHPELGMTAINDIWPEEQFYFRSDHYNFAKNGVPILFFFSGVHPDYHQVTDSPDKIDTEKEARILRLVYYLGQEIGNATERPKWNQASYDKIVRRKP